MQSFFGLAGPFLYFYTNIDDDDDDNNNNNNSPPVDCRCLQNLHLTLLLLGPNTFEASELAR